MYDHKRLERFQVLLQKLGNPEKQIPHYIHVTGTSGKGSTATMVAAILAASGKKVGLLTSPHPSQITQRWQINGVEMSATKYKKILKELQTKLKEYNDLNFFELVALIGFYYFAQEKVDYAVLEVGLGGKYDFTNVIPYKDTAIITNIGKDHFKKLGPSRLGIAKHKVGIITPGCQLLTMENSMYILKMFAAQCKKIGAKFTPLAKQKYTINEINLKETLFNYKGENYKLQLIGEHQIKNAILALETAQTLDIPLDHIKEGLYAAKAPVRMEVIATDPAIILDGAHNLTEISAAVSTTKRLNNILKGDIYLVIGFSKNGNMDKMLRYLAKLKPHMIVCTRKQIVKFVRTEDPVEMAKKLKSIMPKTKIIIDKNYLTAYKTAQNNLAKKDLLLVTGSKFLAGELRTHIKQT
jgi:dihydrofolate synthase/folylpolyglutamate synthase